MSYQSEAQLEEQLIEQLQKQDYSRVIISDYNALEHNFRTQFEKFNKTKYAENHSQTKNGNVF